MKTTKSLYVHIPFCGNICWFCDFKRIKTDDTQIINNYIDKIINQINQESKLNQYTTIYIGGGTPNYLNLENLEKLLSCLDKYLNKEIKYEFSIELNCEYITEEQVKLFKKYNINRVSIGVQSLNPIILQKMNRHHTNQQVIDAILLLRQNNINNINLDFIYNYPNMTIKDINDVFEFIKKHKIVHISFYSLEVKENSILNKQNYKIDLDSEEEQLMFILKKFKELKYKRYEVSNWSKEEKYYCQHNLVYWNNENWKAIGYGAFGFENDIYYSYKGSVSEFYIEKQTLSLEEIYQNILIMGLRKKEGVDLNIEINKKAYLYFKDKLKYINITKENKLIANNIDCLNDILINII